MTLFLAYLTITLTAPVFADADSLMDSTNAAVMPALNRPYDLARDPWFSQDKFLHFYFSATITGLGYHVYADRFQGDERRGKAISVSLTALLGIGKEIYDLKKKHLFSWKDLAWDGLGIAAGYLLFVNL